MPAAATDFTVSSQTSSSHACPDPVVNWNVLMRFWDKTQGDVTLLEMPTTEDLRDAVEQTRAEFVTSSACVVDLTIDGAVESGTYVVEKDNGASAFAGTYDVVWDVYASLGAPYCAHIFKRFPAHAEQPSTPCAPGAPFWIPDGFLLTHEWWHEATEHTLPLLGVQRPLPDTHRFPEYGYTSDRAGSLQFYAEMFAGELSPNGTMRGISETEWALGTNRTAYAAGPADGPPGLRFGRVRNDVRRGTAKLTVIAPGPGKVTLAETSRVKGDRGRANSRGRALVKIKPKRKVKRKLQRTGGAGVTAKVTYRPEVGEPIEGRQTVTLALRVKSDVK